jgi:hypothetical protein
MNAIAHARAFGGQRPDDCAWHFLFASSTSHWAAPCIAVDLESGRRGASAPLHCQPHETRLLAAIYRPVP